jgi:hypothetical protein
MDTHETQYDICLDHAEHLLDVAVRLADALRAYKGRDHHASFLDSPFMLDLNESLFDLNVQAERLIQRLDPEYEGDYTAEGGS